MSAHELITSPRPGAAAHQRLRRSPGFALLAPAATVFALAATMLTSMLTPRFARADPALETETARLPARGELLLGSVAEFQTSKEGDEIAVPVSIEYGLLDGLELLIEPVLFTSILPKHGGRARGLGDMEVTLTYLAFAETAALPAIAIAGEVKIATARNDLIGSGEHDATFYVAASKRFGKLDVHADVGYTFVGAPRGVRLDNTYSFAAAADYHLSDRSDVFAEVLYASASNPQGGAEGTKGGNTNSAGAFALAEQSAEDEVVGTVGLRYHFNANVQLSTSLSYDNSNATLLRAGIQIRL